MQTSNPFDNLNETDLSRRGKLFIQVKFILFKTSQKTRQLQLKPFSLFDIDRRQLNLYD